MTVWEELKARGLIAQVTDEDEIKEMVNNGKATFYIGFDPTADSLHLPDETSADGRQSSDRTSRWRYRYDRRSIRKNRYASDDDKRNHPAQY